MNLLRSLRHRPFALLWTGQLTSRLGDNLYRIALSWWVLEKTGSATAMGTVLVLSQVPMLLFLLVGGVVVDRFPRLRIMFTSDLLNGVVVLFITVLAWLNWLQIWHIYLASVLFGLVEAFFFPAYQAVVPQITPPELLTSANSLNGLSQRVMGIIGPALGAALVAAGGTSLAFGLDALSFFFSALCVWPVLRAGLDRLPGPGHGSEQAGEPARPGPGDGSLKSAFRQGLADLREGWNAIITIPWIWITILVFGFINITETSPRAVALPFLIKSNLGGDVKLLGLFSSAGSLGFALGALWLGQKPRLHRRGLLAYLATTCTGVATFLFGWKLPVPVLVAGTLISGLTTAVFSLIWVHTLQEMVPKHLLGRVSSIDALGSFVLLPIGFSLAGWGTDVVGAPAVFLVSGLGTIILTLLPLLHPAIRNLD